MSGSPFSIEKSVLEAISMRLRLEGYHHLNMGVLIFPKEKFAFPEDELWFCSRRRPVSSNWNFPWSAITGRPGADDDPSPAPPLLLPEAWVKTTTEKDYLSVAQEMAAIEGNICMSVDPDAMTEADFHKFVFLVNTLTGTGSESRYADETQIAKLRGKLNILDKLKARDESIISTIEADEDYAQLRQVADVSVHIVSGLMEMFEKPAPAPSMTM